MKPVAQIVLSGETKPVEDESVVKSLVYPLDQETRAAVFAWMDASSEQLKDAVIRDKHERLEAARAASKHVQWRCGEHAPRVAESEAAWRRIAPGSFICGLAMTPFVASCMGMEFVISWIALSQLFGVSPDSVLGVMLGVGPTAALAVLKVVVARLFEDAYQDLLRGLVQSPKSRFIVRTCMVAFLIAVAVLNVYTIVVQAKVREEVSIAAAALLKNDDVTDFTPVRSEAAVMATSLAVSINGAILFVIMWNEFGCWSRRRSARKTLAADRATMEALNAEATRAEADVAAREKEDVVATARVAAERRRQELRILMCTEESRQVQSRTALQAVTHDLRTHRLRALKASA
jgi:hypothetical protein